MKKLLLSVALMGSLANATQESSKQGIIRLQQNAETGLWKQVTTPRPAEQDVHTSFELPWTNGKKLEINLSQVANGSMAAISAYAGYKLNKNLYAPREKCLSLGVCSDPSAHMRYKKNLPFIALAAIPSTLVFGYKYLMGEQKIPFKIIDPQANQAQQ